MTATLYGHRLSQPCRAAEILLRELNIPYDWHEIDFAHGETHASWYAERINPFETVPALAVAAEAAGGSSELVLGESHAIMRYACRTAETADIAGPWYPGDNDSRRAARIDEWMAWHHNNIRRYDLFHDIMNLHLTLPMLKREIQQNALKPLQDSLSRGLAVLEQHFERRNEESTDHPTLCGGPHPTLADLTLTCELYQIVAIGYRFDRYPQVARWLDGMAERRHFQNVSEDLLEQGRTIREQSGDYLDLERAFG